MAKKTFNLKDLTADNKHLNLDFRLVKSWKSSGVEVLIADYQDNIEILQAKKIVLNNWIS